MYQSDDYKKYIEKNFPKSKWEKTKTKTKVDWKDTAHPSKLPVWHPRYRAWQNEKGRTGSH